MKIMIVGYDYFHYAQSLVNACNLMGHQAIRLPVHNFSEVEQQQWKIRVVKLGFRNFEKTYEKTQIENFIQRVDTFMPDVCIVLNGNSVKEGFLSAVKERGIKLVLFMIDSLQEDNFQIFLSQMVFYDKIFSYESTDKLIRPEFNIDYMFIGYDETIFNLENRNNKDIDISFVGLLDRGRLNLLEKVAEYADKNGKKIFVHTKSYKESHIFHKIRNYFKRKKLRKEYPFLSKFLVDSTVCNNDLANVYQRSKICINIHKDHGSHTDVNPRAFEILGCGAFQLIDQGHLDNIEIKSGIHLVEYANANDLCRKIDYYLNKEDERETIARKGCHLARSKYTMRECMKKILEEIN